MKRASFTVALIAAFSFALPSVLAEVTFTRIAATGMPTPDGSAVFSRFGSSPSIDAGNVAFYAGGIYGWIDGRLTTLANNATVGTAPGSYLYSFGYPSISGNSVAFTASEQIPDAPSRSGVYMITNGALKLVASSDDFMPGTSYEFQSFQNISLDSGNVAFGAYTLLPDGSHHTGLYAQLGGAPLTAVADSNTPMPDSTVNFNNMYYAPDVQGSRIAFTGGHGDAGGWYEYADGAISTLLRIGDPVPRSPKRFFRGGPVSIDGADAAFGAIAQTGSPDPIGGQGIYARLAGELRTIVEPGNPVPSGGGIFTGTHRVSITAGKIAFSASTTTTGSGIYLYANGAVSRVIDDYDALDGKTIMAVHSGPQAFDGDTVVFRVIFTDDSDGIYTARISGPPTPTPTWSASGGTHWNDPPNDWNDPSNWIGGVPDASAAIANFGPTSATWPYPARVSLNGDRTIGRLYLNSDSPYLIVPGSGGSLIFKNGGGTALIFAERGTHSIAAPVVLEDNADFRASLSNNTFTSAKSVRVRAGRTFSTYGNMTVTQGIQLESGAALSVQTHTLSVGMIDGDETTSIDVGYWARTAALTANSLSTGSLTIFRRNKVIIGADGSTSRVAGLTFEDEMPGDTGTLDLLRGRLVVAATDSSRDAVLRYLSDRIKIGFSSPSYRWQGQGITSSVAAPNPLTGLAIALNDRGDGSRLWQDEDINAILIAYTLNGDTNLDFTINALDYFAIDSGFLAGATGYANGDFNYDGVINALDYTLIDAAFLGQSTLSHAPSATSIPEPSTLLPLSLAIAALTTRRRRKT